eukprot:scaffold4116_cov27-Tisochrysis_lutea.AAC.2
MDSAAADHDGMRRRRRSKTIARRDALSDDNPYASPSNNVATRASEAARSVRSAGSGPSGTVANPGEQPNRDSTAAVMVVAPFSQAGCSAKKMAMARPSRTVINELKPDSNEPGAATEPLKARKRGSRTLVTAAARKAFAVVSEGLARAMRRSLHVEIAMAEHESRGVGKASVKSRLPWQAPSRPAASEMAGLAVSSSSAAA